MHTLSVSYACRRDQESAEEATQTTGAPKRKLSDLTDLVMRDSSPPYTLSKIVDMSTIGLDPLLGPSGILATMGVYLLSLIRESAYKSMKGGRGFNVDETYARTIDLLLRFLFRVQAKEPGFVTKNKLQVIGVTAAWICCKLEEPDRTELRTFAGSDDRDLDSSVYIKMESFILFVVGWEGLMTSPTPYDHLIQQIKGVPTSELSYEEVNVAILILQITQYSEYGHETEFDFLAAGALYYSILTLRSDRRLFFGDKGEMVNAVRKEAMSFTTKQCGLPECVIWHHAKMHHRAMVNYTFQHSAICPVMGTLDGGQSGVDDLRFISYEWAMVKSTFELKLSDATPSEQEWASEKRKGRERAKKKLHHINYHHPDQRELNNLLSSLLSTNPITPYIDPQTNRPTKRHRTDEE